MTEALLNIADSFEAPIKAALVKAFIELKDSVQIMELTNALRSYGITGAYQYLANLQIEGVIDKYLVEELNTAILTSGRTTVETLPNGVLTPVPFRFNLLNRTTAQYIQDYQYSLVQQISANTREAIRKALEADVIAGRNPITTARRFRSTLGLTPKQEKAVRNFEEGLINGDRAVLNRKLRDKRFDSTVLRSIKGEKPLTKTQINKMVDRYRQRSILYRSQSIARTEALRAISIGSFNAVVQAVNEGAVEREKLRRFWVFTRDKRTRDPHRKIPQMNEKGVEVDQAFTTPLGPLMFPRDPNGSGANTIRCRCSVVYRIVDPEDDE